MKNKEENFRKHFFVLLLFYAGCLFLYYVSSRILTGVGTIADKNFLNWDAMHYMTIQRNGYYSGMVAFFPLFPYFWKLTQFGSIGIGLLNGLLYIASFAWLASIFSIPQKRLLLLASIPVIIFMFLPFSESVFFLTSAMLLAGLKKNNFLLVIAGIFLSGLARPVATVFIPAIIILHWFVGDNSGNSLKKTLGMMLACAGSMLLVFLLQYYQTGEWLSFFRVQREWGNSLRLPAFPLTSWAGGLIVRLDAMAFFFGIAASVYLAILTIQKIKSGDEFKQGLPLLFSLCYLSILALVVLFSRGGVINSLNRYLFCTAFFIVALDYVLSQKFFSGKNALLLFLVSTSFWLIFASYVHIQTVLKFEFLSLYILLLLISTSENNILKNTGYYSVMTCNIILMIFFFQRFLSGGWVG